MIKSSGNIGFLRKVLQRLTKTPENTPEREPRFRIGIRSILAGTMRFKSGAHAPPRAVLRALAGHTWSSFCPNRSVDATISSRRAGAPAGTREGACAPRVQLSVSGLASEGIAKSIQDAQSPSYRFTIPPWMFWIATLLLAPQVLFGEERVDRTLVPSIFTPESAPAHSISHLADFVLSITGVMFVLVAGLLAYVVIRYRRRANDDGMEPAQVYGSGPVEAAWTTVPFLIVLVLTLATARVIFEVQDARKPVAALDVQIIGHQWWWEIRYPKLGIVTANELHVPVSQRDQRLPTFLDLRSADVVHSFWVPRLAGKTDLIPNKVNSMWIEPERTGLFVGQCAKYCGTQHAKMLLRVYAETPGDFERWVAQQKKLPENDRAAAAGKLVFERTACINCHAIGDSSPGDRRFGPNLAHLMGRDTLASGAVSNSPANLRAWIKSPEQFKPGVLMPAMNLNDSDLDKLVAYLTTLK